MTDLDRYKLAAEKFRFLVHLWIQEGCVCACSQCKEILDEAEALLVPWNKDFNGTAEVDGVVWTNVGPINTQTEETANV
jgi:hypothetical protein